jgi:hypothetical protein
MKIKIIDLLNKIANNEEVPEKIKINNVIYEYRGYMYCTEKANYQDIEDYLFGKWNFNILNNYAEIIEEPKNIEYEQIEELTCNEYDFEKKTINSLIKNQRKLIDEIKNLKEE